MTSVMKTGFEVLAPGMLSLIQDAGRYGQAKLGLTSSGPADKVAYDWANRLLQNPNNCATLEVTFGGLKLMSHVDTVICVTGAELELKIAGIKRELWQTHKVSSGQLIELGFATQGVRSYLAVKGGFELPAQFSSCATVLREGIGGLDGDKLKAGDVLPCSGDMPKNAATNRNVAITGAKLRDEDIPSYQTELCLRVILGYQQASFSALEQRRFFSSEYQVSKQWDRMGYRLSGPAIQSSLTTMLSEGICLGAVQIPADGQPIVLMQDRQTIGGYPKIGSVFSMDLAKLAQVGQGAKVHFEPMSIESAHNELHLQRARQDRCAVQTIELV